MTLFIWSIWVAVAALATVCALQVRAQARAERQLAQHTQLFLASAKLHAEEREAIAMLGDILIEATESYESAPKGVAN